MVATLFAAVFVLPLLRGDEPLPVPSSWNGKWIVTELVVSGKPIPISKSQDSFWFEIDGEEWRYSFVAGKRATAKFKVTLNANNSQILVDAKLQNGVFANGVCKGICRIDRDTMRLCLADNPSIARPNQFDCPKESGLLLIQLRRAQPRNQPDSVSDEG
jgi:uncharacterized protein (TIGR03067 family)